MADDNRNPKRHSKNIRKSGQFRPISMPLNASTKRLRQKRGFVDPALLAQWDMIIGSDLAAICQPKEIKTRRGQGAVLVLECLSAYASELQMRTDEIVMRINSNMGAGRIAKIVLSQQHIGFDKRSIPATRTSELQESSAPKKGRDVPLALSQVLASTQDDGLRDALKNISDSFYKKGF